MTQPVSPDVPDASASTDPCADDRPVAALMLLGPTGSGKSALALALAAQHAVEIISVDSAQVYRGLDIGTAKPTPEERARVPHHLIDLRDAAQPYSAAEFVRDAAAAIDDIRSRGRLPLLVGGTMLYAKALRDGLAALPAADHDVRAELEAEARAHGWPALHARLATLDAVTAARLAPNDSQRIQRALEVIAVTGAPLSSLLAMAERPRHRLEIAALVPQQRAVLHHRLEQRFDAMLAAGFIEEVSALRARGDLAPELPALRSVGYRQAWAYLDGAVGYAEFRAAAIAATRQLAKRQFTWLRSLAPAITLDPQADLTRALLAQRLEALARFA
jgi:tRNA dimethylallyltransferase